MPIVSSRLTARKTLSPSVRELAPITSTSPLRTCRPSEAKPSPGQPGELDHQAKALRRVAWLLTYLGYDPADVADVVEHCRRQGTSEGCNRIGAVDRPHVEALLANPA